ncbi:MAG: TRAP transporter substrate-binding protein [Clostridiales bacterium]|nr:TRAP transporter substrate-binding protein [Clostridiales bacterium]
MKKRIASVLITAAVVMTQLCGCSITTKDAAQTATTAAQTEASAAKEEAAAEAGGEQIRFVMGHAGNDDLTDGIMALKFNELLEERSGGRITVDYKTNSTLGEEDELVQQVMNGSIQATCVSTSTFSDYTNIMDALQLPFLYSDYETERTALKSDAAKALYKDMEDFGLKITDVCEIGLRHFANNIRPINTMEDLSGIKMRIVPSTLLTDVAAEIKMDVTPVAYGEIYSALQSKVIDGEEINLISIVSNSHDEVLKYVSLIGFYSFPSALTFNLDWYNSLSAEDQALIEECSAEAMDYAMDKCEQIDKDSLAACEERGLEINTISEEEKQRFIDACQPVYDKYCGDNENIKNYVEYVRGL